MQTLPGYQFDVVSNQGTFINDSIGEVKDSAVLGIFLAVMIIWAHRTNIGRLMRGEESKFSFKKKK